MFSNARLGRPLNARITEHFHLAWLDENINGEDYQNSITKLRKVVSRVNTFTDTNECINFVSDINQEVTFMIVSEEVSHIIIPRVQELSQVNSVYILLNNNAQHENWTKQCFKVKGVFTNIESICKALEKAVHECNRNSVSLSFAKQTSGTVEHNMDTLDQSYMYTQLLTEILLTIDFEQSHFQKFLTYCRKKFADSIFQLAKIDKIEKEYRDGQSIYWYTDDSFLYSMLNRALRLMEVDLIIVMGFFVRDLHHDIKELHAKQYSGERHSKSFTVYRGQGLSQSDFEQLEKTKGGLMSFNSFLSTSMNRAVGNSFAESNQDDPDLIGALFEINIDPSISSSPFANVRDVSCIRDEEEILISMHSVFRIEKVEKINGNDRLYQVNLTLTSDNDPQLNALTKFMQQETFSDYGGWHRLGKLMIKLGRFSQAEELYTILFEKTNNEGEKANLYHMLGTAKSNQGKYAEASESYKKSISIKEKTSPSNHADLANFYNDTGSVSFHMGNYFEARLYYEDALKIRQKTLSENHPDYAQSYNNIGNVSNKMGEYGKALSYYEKAVKIYQKTFPANHPNIATSYNNIGSVYESMGEYSEALSSHEKALEIRQKILPENHPDMATLYNNIGLVYNKMKEYSKALSYYKKALEIQEKNLSINPLARATSYNHLGTMYCDMKQYLKALSYYEKSLEIRQNLLPANHTDVASSYNNIGNVYYHVPEYSKALSYYQKTLEINLKILPANHPQLAISYNNIGLVYKNMKRYSEALLSYETALEIYQNTPPTNHLNLISSYNSIGSVCNSMGEYSKALSYYGKILDIRENILPGNHRDLAASYNNIGCVHNSLKDYPTALLSHKAAIASKQRILPADHPDLATSYNNIGSVYNNMGEYLEALSYFKCALNIWKLSLPPNHSRLEIVKTNIEIVKRRI